MAVAIAAVMLSSPARAGEPIEIRVPTEVPTLAEAAALVKGADDARIIIETDELLEHDIVFSGFGRLEIVAGRGFEPVVNAQELGRICSFSGFAELSIEGIAFVNASDRALQVSGGRLWLRECRLENNRHDNTGGAMFLSGCDCRIIRCDFIGNRSPQGYGQAGAIYNSSGSRLVVAGSRFHGNSASYVAGAIRSIGHARAHIHSSIFTDNSSCYGGAVENYGGHTVYSNCTFVGNSAACGGVVGSHYGSVRMVNCVFGSGQGIWSTSGSSAFKAIACIAAWGTLPGIGNLHADPMLDAEFRPMAGSPCIDAGSCTGLLRELDMLDDEEDCQWLAWDANGDLRFQDDLRVADAACRPGSGSIDLGAVERSGVPADATPFGDCDGDGVVRSPDLGIMLSAWGSGSSSACAADLNLDGVVNGGDLALLLAEWTSCDTGP